MSGEILAIPLLVRHNVRYYLRLMEKIRDAIQNGNFNIMRKKGIPHHEPSTRSE
jgi:tRNA-guanine family transglycosylase